MLLNLSKLFSSVQFSSLSCVWLLAKPCPAASSPGFPVHHQLLEPTQSHVYCVGDAIQPSHPLSFPSPTVFHTSQHQGLFAWVGLLHKVAKVLEFQLQHQFFQWIIQDWFSLGWTGWILNSQESSPTPQLKSINSSTLSFLYSPTLTSIHDYWKNHSFD